MDRDVWNSLSQFQTFDLVQREFSRRHKRKLSAQQTWEIIACFIQAQEYFRNANAAAETVRPLLLYYGVLAMSRGIILFLDVQAREATLSVKHGLSARTWQKVLSKGIANILQLEVKIQNGTYTELAQATQNRIVSETPIVGGVLELAGLRPQLGESSPETINFRDLLSRIPRICGTYRDVTETRPNVFPGTIIINGDAGVIRISRDEVVGLATAEEVRTIFRVPEDVEIGAWQGEPMFPLPNFAYRLRRAKDDLAWRPMLEDFRDYHGSLVVPWPNGGYISPLLRCFVAAYFLGMLARYYPSRWMALIRNAKGDVALPLLRATIGHVEHDFPRLALDALGAEGF